MQDKKVTKTVKMLRTAAVPVTLAVAVALVFLATAGLCPSCPSNSGNDPIENEEAAAGELVANLNVDNFSASIAEGVTLVDFWAPWSGPCGIQGPILDEVAESVRGRAKIAKVNVDDAGSIAGQFGVQSIPTLVLFKAGNEVRRFIGVQSQETLIEAIDKLKQGL